jgi:hypothetical protein
MKCNFLLTITALIITMESCSPGTENANSVSFGDSTFLANVPDQPGEDTWKFIEDLKSPMWTHHPWNKVNPGSHDADLSKGIKLKISYPDPKGRLETAYEDLRLFLAAGGISFDNGKYLLETVVDMQLKSEAFRIDIQNDRCIIMAGDLEGIRRGIFYLEDEMLRHRGPFLTVGMIEKQPIIQRRISRCFFGPIKRFPKMRDELMDSVNYYPDQYLNRLAHEGVNGLWLTVEFRDLVATRYTPEAGKNGEKRLEKLKQTVEACLRYGIRTYIFCIEPREWDADSPAVKYYPELAGAPDGSQYFFCPISQTAHNYLYESVNKIFKAVPELGGLINITHGEMGTTCLSTVSNLSQYHKGMINCPRCSHKEPWEILYASLSAMEQGMHDASPNAELISWLYMPDPYMFNSGDTYELGDWVYELPAHTPKGVILQFNFESGVTRTVFGKFLVGGDYWISIPGPSSRFSQVAKIARENRTKVSAKIQTGCSHEVASIPFVPVPALLYRKFSAMKSLGVTHTMLCWYFGNYPGLMNKVSGELSFDPFPTDGDSFLNRLASTFWREEDVSKVVEAWKYFSDGYENYPTVNRFQWYGPMHDGPVWPLLLIPMDTPLSPTWEIGSGPTLRPWPPSGDRIGECIGNVLTLKETVELCRRMSVTWDKGIAILNKMEPRYSNEPDRILDIGVAKALGIQFRSGYNILRFYLLREEMFRIEGKKRLDILKQLGDIVREEIDNDKQLLVLCEKDSRLGFHSEAEGYKYFPEKIRWRMNQLSKVLTSDIPELKKLISDNKLLFPEYTGKEPAGNVANAIPYPGSWPGPGFDTPQGLQWQPCSYGSDKSSIQWAAAYDTSALYIIVSDSDSTNQSTLVPTLSGITVRIEPRRLWFCTRFGFNPADTNQKDEIIRVVNESGKRKVIMRIPFKRFWWSDEGLHPVRVDVQVLRMDGRTSSWCPDNPLNYRLTFGTDNPADLGWLVFRNK